MTPGAAAAADDPIGPAEQAPTRVARTHSLAATVHYCPPAFGAAG